MIWVDDILAGFALIDDDLIFSKDSDYSMGEFFVMYKFRRLGVCKYVATCLFDQYSGKWEVGVHPDSSNSVKFWTNMISTSTNGKYILHEKCKGLAYHNGSLGNVNTFDNSQRNLQ